MSIRRHAGKWRNLRVLLHAYEFACALYYSSNRRTVSTRRHLELTAAGLLNASKKSRDGGYAMRYSLYLNWDIGYVETTGYIIPTALELAEALGDSALRLDALGHGPWLLTHQREGGGFPGASRAEPVVFDTAQVLIGLERLFKETGERRYLSAANEAAEWLVEELDRFLTSARASRGIPTYNARSAGALIEYGVSRNEPRYVDCGERFLRWVTEQRLPSGLFEGAQLGDDSDFLLHTSIYVIEGFLMAHAALGKIEWLEAAIDGAQCFKRVNLDRDGVLFSHYGPDMAPTTNEWCLPGLCQWALVCLTLFSITQEPEYRECARRALEAVKSKQIRAPGALRGAIAGSAPFWGRYEKMAFPNWSLKYFADALLLWQRLGLDASASHSTQAKPPQEQAHNAKGRTLTAEECAE